MKRILFLLMLIISILVISCTPREATTTNTEPYEPTWESLSKHNEEPDWFKDAKLGIYFHWGVYSVPAYGDEWYPRNMLFKNRKEYEHHKATYGDPSEFGYHDFVPMFKAENFNADEWAQLFKAAGARFAGPVAEHHDGFSMWASKFTPWNSKDKGPKKDITGELEKAIRSNGMRLITTFHHARNLQRYAHDTSETKFNNSHYPLFKGTVPISDDPELRYLYGNIPEEEWLEQIWFGKLKEVIDNYHPDIIWFDSWLDQIPESYLQKFSAYYLNQAAERDQEVVIVRKQEDLPLSLSINDLEKSRMNRMGEKAWMTDETISTGSWCYTENLTIKPTVDLLHVLIDIVSKNGVLLLNISPKADGTIPDDQRNVLLEMGQWLNKYGEAIYETRSWITYGEGPTKEPEGDFKNHKEFLKVKYSEKDIRFTQKENTLYAIVLGWPGNGEKILLESFAKEQLPENFSIKAISMLGSSEDIVYNLNQNGLEVICPSQPVDQMAVVFKMELGEGRYTKAQL